MGLYVGNHRPTIPVRQCALECGHGASKRRAALRNSPEHIAIPLDHWYLCQQLEVGGPRRKVLARWPIARARRTVTSRAVLRVHRAAMIDCITSARQRIAK